MHRKHSPLYPRDMTIAEYVETVERAARHAGLVITERHFRALALMALELEEQVSGARLRPTTEESAADESPPT